MPRKSHFWFVFALPVIVSIIIGIIGTSAVVAVIYNQLKKPTPTPVPTTGTPGTRAPTAKPLTYYEDADYIYSGDTVTSFPTVVLEECIPQIQNFYNDNPAEANAVGKFFYFNRNTNRCWLAKNASNRQNEMRAETWVITS